MAADNNNSSNSLVFGRWPQTKTLNKHDFSTIDRSMTMIKSSMIKATARDRDSNQRPSSVSCSIIEHVGIGVGVGVDKTIFSSFTSFLDFRRKMKREMRPSIFSTVFSSLEPTPTPMPTPTLSRRFSSSRPSRASTDHNQSFGGKFVVAF